MDEASLCDRIALIQNGKILSINTPQGVVKEFQKPLFAVRSPHMLSLLNTLKEFDEVEDAYPFGQYHHVVMRKDGSEEKLHSFLDKKLNEGYELNSTNRISKIVLLHLMKES